MGIDRHSPNLRESGACSGFARSAVQRGRTRQLCRDSAIMSIGYPPMALGQELAMLPPRAERAPWFTRWQAVLIGISTLLATFVALSQNGAQLFTLLAALLPLPDSWKATAHDAEFERRLESIIYSGSVSPDYLKSTFGQPAIERVASRYFTDICPKITRPLRMRLDSKYIRFF